MHKPLENFLDSADGATRVLPQARLILKLSRRLEHCLPAGLRDAARVANYKSGKVVIHTDNGAVATKVRQMSQRLGDELSREGLQCSVIEVKVQPLQIPFESRRSTWKPLSAQASGTISATARKLPDGPLRQALERLLQRSLKQE